MADVLSQNVLKKYNVGPVQPYIQYLADLIGTRFNLKSIGGYRKADDFRDHPSGNALDFMITSREQGDQIAQFLIDNHAAFGMKYIIWNRRTWNPTRGTWAPYTSTSNPHTDHVHFTGIGLDGKDTSGLAASLSKYSVTGGTTQTSTGGGFDAKTCAMPFTMPKYEGVGPDFGGGKICLLSKVQARVPVATFMFITATVVGLVGVTLLVAYGFKASGASDVISVLSKVPGVKKGASAAKKAA